MSRCSLDWVDLDPALNHQCTSLSRTLVELAASMPEPNFAIAFESGWRRYRYVREELDAHLEEVPRRSGSQILRRVLADSRRRPRPLRSALEVRMSRFLVEHRLPMPEPDLKVVDREGVMFLDFAYPERRFAIETDGKEHHSGESNRIKDARRRQRLIALGWTVFVVTWVELKEHADRLLDRLRRSFDRYPRSKRPVTGLGIVRVGG